MKKKSKKLKPSKGSLKAKPVEKKRVEPEKVLAIVKSPTPDPEPPRKKKKIRNAEPAGPRNYILVNKGTKDPVAVPSSPNIDNIRKLRAHLIAFIARETGKKMTLGDMDILNTITNSVVLE